MRVQQGSAATGQALAGQTDIVSTKGLDQEIITGDNIGQIVGVKIATPFFGTGFNFCIGAALSGDCRVFLSDTVLQRWVYACLKQQRLPGALTLLGLHALEHKSHEVAQVSTLRVCASFLTWAAQSSCLAFYCRMTGLH